MKKLTTEQWAQVRTNWEADTREGFQWLSKEIEISRQVISRRADKEGWQKSHATAQAKPKGTRKEPAQKGEHCALRQEQAIFDTRQASSNAIFDAGERTIGRPTAYHSSYAETAKKLCLAFGATDAQLAQWFEVSEQTINNWKGAHPDFLASIQQGKAIADANVALALYERATGYSHADVHISVWQGEAIVTPITKQYPPDVAAAKYWLNNRQPTHWRNQVEVEVSANVSAPTIAQLDAIYEAGMQKMRQSREVIELRRLQLAQATVAATTYVPEPIPDTDLDT